MIILLIYISEEFESEKFLSIFLNHYPFTLLQFILSTLGETCNRFTIYCSNTAYIAVSSVNCKTGSMTQTFTKESETKNKNTSTDYPLGPRFPLCHYALNHCGSNATDIFWKRVGGCTYAFSVFLQSNKLQIQIMIAMAIN